MKELDTGPLAHKVLAGIDYQTSFSTFRTGSSVASSEYDLYPDSPDYGRSGSALDYSSGSDYTFRQTGIYAQDQITFLDRWHANFSVRQDWASCTQYEAGIKYQSVGFNGFFSIAVYHLKEKNISKYAGYNSTVGYYYEPIGEVTSNGIEAQARFNLDMGLSVIASYTFNDAEITGDITASNIGNVPMVTPRHSASLWLDYAFKTAMLDGVSLGAGMRYLGETYTSNANTAKNKSATLFDAALRYDFGAAKSELDGLSAALNVNNIVDWQPTTCNNGYCYLGALAALAGGRPAIAAQLAFKASQAVRPLRSPPPMPGHLGCRAAPAAGHDQSRPVARDQSGNPAAVEPNLIVSTPYLERLREKLERIAPVRSFAIHAISGPAMPPILDGTRALTALTATKAKGEALIEAAFADIASLSEVVRPLRDRPLLLANILDPRHLRVYGRNSLFDDVLTRLGLTNAWTGHSNVWGFATLGVDELADVANARLVCFDSVPGDAARAMRESPVWRALGFAEEGRILQLPTVLAFGMLPSATRFAPLLSEAERG
ncbi:TonB-dependent receptor [Breoghania sp.]|uniref:TonB-dependent receptor domain-containing protein n=1 Tax=Breoghania sp. TaxID=2065378 RepID=UPI002624DEF7|nr:TonB-dependent receptor [Breoghania sp.]MDJ0930599.1 TonB-dependent receptor [Breoghania sp.]